MTEYGRYELIEQIGQGALTEVFRAKRYGVEGFEKILVVKRLHQRLSNDHSLVQSFVRRGQQALRLSHSNVVHALDLGEVATASQKSYFIATELVSGTTLEALLAQQRESGKPLTLEMALYIASEVSRALDHAHRRRDAQSSSVGIAHEKLTAANVFLSDEGEVKVSDFCTAAIGVGVNADSGGQITGDLVALGSLLYEMLRLTPPPQIEPDTTFVGFGLPVDDLLGRLLLGDPGFGAAEAHEQLLMHAYACRDWVGAEQIGDLVAEWRRASPERRIESQPAPLPSTQSSQPPPIATSGAAASFSLGDFRPFVGRSAETAAVGQRLALVAERKLQALAVLGPAGIGKTRFVLELKRRLKRGGLNLAFHVVRCPVAGKQQPYSAVVAMLRSIFGVEGTRPPDGEALMVALRTLGLSGPRANAILCELGVGSQAEVSAPPLSSAVERVFASLADDRMHVFAWDDAERMDAASANLLAAVAEALTGKRIALLFAARELASSALQRIESYHEVHLGTLDSAALKRLIQVRLGIARIPEQLEDFVARRSGGNTMFAEELLREGVSCGAIQVRDAAVASLDIDRLALLPASLETELAQRVRRLSDAELQVLRLVAYLDEWAEVPRIAQAIGHGEAETAALLVGLHDKNLITMEQERARLPTRLIDAALRVDATPDQLAAMELRAADALLQGATDDARQLERAAFALEAAGEPVRAATTYERAARVRAANARPERTIPLVLRALELMPLEARPAEDIAASIELLADSPVAGAQTSRLTDAVRRLSSHLLASSDMERTIRVDALLNLVRLQRSSMHFHEAQQLLLRTQALAKQDRQRLARVLLQLADTQIALGDFQPAIETLQRFDRVVDDPEETQRHEALVLSAHAHAQAGDRVVALELLNKAEALAPTEDDERAFRTAQVRALVHALSGEWQLSRTAAAAAATRARSLGRVQRELSYRHYEGEALTQLGEHARAYAAFRSSLALARDIGSERWVNRNRMLLAFLEGRTDTALAKRRIGECLGTAERQHQTQDVAKGRLLLGLLLRSEGDETGAQHELQLARQVAVSIGHGLLVSECDAALAVQR